jgi:7-carboxy-7-deazaguanine synthase
MQNTQLQDNRPYSKVLQNPRVDSGYELPLMESFYTIQGEGAHRGKAAYFIRLGGCPVGCVWCDVKDSWDVKNHPITQIDLMVQDAVKNRGRIAVITGGEPAAFEMGPLTGALKEAGFRTHIETSGVFELSGEWDWICFSPKKFKKPTEDIYNRAHELKVVVYNKSDFDWAVKHASKVNPNCKLYLQPEWSKAKEMMPLIVEFIKEHPEWEISLQIHKYMEIP